MNHMIHEPFLDLFPVYDSNSPIAYHVRNNLMLKINKNYKSQLYQIKYIACTFPPNKHINITFTVSKQVLIYTITH